MSAPQIVPDSAIIKAYQDTGSVWKAGELLGIRGSSLHERLVKLGANKRMNVLTEKDDEILKKEYLIYKAAGKLNDLAVKMGRTKPFICRRARALGLTQRSSPKLYKGKWKYMSEETARIMMDDFKASPLILSRFCKVRGYGEVGFWQTMTKYFGDEWEHVIESKVPKTTMYRRGRGFEYFARNVLRRKGYFVLRSPASRSPIDLVAIRPGVVLFVQCKIDGSLSPIPWNELIDLSQSTGTIPILAMRKQQRLIEFFRLICKKDGTKKAQPMELFNID